MIGKKYLQECKNGRKYLYLSHSKDLVASMKARQISSNDLDFIAPIKCGGQSKVYLAKLRGKHNRPSLAVKVYELKDHRQPYFVERTILSLACHSSIPQLIAYFEEDSQAGLALPYLTGITLAELIGKLRQKKVNLCLKITRYLANQLILVLSYLHRDVIDEKAVVIHNDLSPDNVFITNRGEVYLLDYGAAFLGPTLRAHDSTFGKQNYLAPELLEGRPTTSSCDLYSFGAVIFESILLRPFQAGGYRNEFVALNAILGTSYETLFKIIRSCLAPIPAYRPKNAQLVHNFIRFSCRSEAQKAVQDLIFHVSP